MADCNSLESLLSSLTSEISTLKTRVATLERDKDKYATKSELASAIDSVRRLIESSISELRRLIESAISEVKNFVVSAIAELRNLIESLLGRKNNDLEGRVKNLEIRVGGLEGIIDRLRGAIDSIQSRLGRLEGQISSILNRLSSAENTIGTIIQDIKNIYNILSKLKPYNDAALWAAIALLQAQIAGILLAIANLLRLLKALPSGRNGINGRNGKDGKDGRNGKDGKDGSSGKNGLNGSSGKDGLNGSSGKNGLNGSSGKDGKNGINGKDGRDLEVKFSNINVTVFASCGNNGLPIYQAFPIKVIQGTELQIAREYQEIAQLRAEICTPKEAIKPEDYDGEFYGEIDVSIKDLKFVIPNDALKIVIEFREIKSYVSKRFSDIKPKFKAGIGSMSFLVSDYQSPDIILQYEKMVLEVPKAFRNSSRYGYIYLEDCKAKISFMRKK